MRKKTRIVSVGMDGKQGIANQDNVDALAGDTGDVYDISTLDASVFLDEMAPTTCKIVTCTTGTVYRSSWRPYLCHKQWNGGQIFVMATINGGQNICVPSESYATLLFRSILINMAAGHARVKTSHRCKWQTCRLIVKYSINLNYYEDWYQG